MKSFAGIALVLAAASLVACGSGASDLQSQSETEGLMIVDAIPAGYVKTPHGLYHSSCVHELADGAEIDASGRIVNPDGTTAQISQCAYRRAELRADAVTGEETDGWVEYASGWATAPITKMTARFTVPASPATASGQLVYFFPGMEPSDGTIILQPVLQFGTSPAGGAANSWGIASWSCGPSCVHSKLVAANAGDSLSGSITGSKCTAAGQCTWKIVTVDNTTGHSTSITTHGDTEAYTWLQSGVLEAYNVTDCAQYPTTSASFSHIAFYDATGALQAPAWAPNETGALPACNFGVTPASAGATLAY